MPRIARNDLNTPFLHVMVQGVNKEYIFENDYLIEKYLEILGKNIDSYDLTILAYCIMNNHAHFLIHTNDIKSFGQFMHKTNLLYSNVYNNLKNRCGVIFRNRYKAEPIFNVSYIINCIAYIHNNPVKAKIVSKCEDYKYSSYNDFINHTGATQSSVMKSIFGNECDYKSIFNELIEKKFMDTDDTNSYEFNKEYISNGIQDFIKTNSINLTEIFSNQKTFKKLIIFLHQQCNFTYIYIQKYFNISNSTIQSIIKS